MSTLYVLRLSGGKYYVGKTDDVMRRYEEHLNGSGSVWTRLHPPISLVKTMTAVSPFDEDKTVKEYMGIYGIDNVRGGTYVREILPDTVRDLIQKEIWAAQGKCTRCGSRSHFATSCSRSYTATPSNKGCYRCGREGHYERDCYARTDINGYELDSEDEEEDEDKSEYDSDGSY
jgi:GAG-polyprotein viral zinc-finger